MAAAVSISQDYPQIGVPFKAVCTGFAATTAITVRIANPEANLDVVVKGTTDGSGNFTSDASALTTPNHEGIWTFTCSDGTSTVVKTQNVNA